MSDEHFTDLINLADRMDIPIFILEVLPDEKLIFRKLNTYHEGVSGLRSIDIEGASPSDILPARMADNITAKYLTCIRSGELYTYEEVLDLPNGQLWWQTTLSPIIGDDGRVIGILGTGIDITARKEREMRDAVELARMRQLNEETNMYTSMAAHDVRGPLRKIKVISELIFADSDGVMDPDAPLVLNDQQKEMVSSIGQIAAKTLGHVDSILSYSRALSHAEALELEPCDLRMMCADLVSLNDGDAKFNVCYPDQIILAERILLQIVLRNLIENAMRFGKSACRVTVDVDDRDSEQLIFRISDDGPGFPDPDSVFATSAVSSLRTAVSGFGLASAQRMIESRGNAIWIEPSVLANGATIAFSMRGSLIEPTA